MAVAVKTTAIKASAMNRSEALFRDGIEPKRMDVSNNTVPMGSEELPRNEPDGPWSDRYKNLSATRNTAQKTHC